MTVADVAPAETIVLAGRAVRVSCSIARIAIMAR
jgi:hypothetical protein